MEENYNISQIHLSASVFRHNSCFLKLCVSVLNTLFAFAIIIARS